MLREVVPPLQQDAWDDQQRLDQICGRLRQIDPELVEWTLLPAGGEGKALWAGLRITDARRPLRQLAELLRRLAAEIDGLDETTTSRKEPVR